MDRTQHIVLKLKHWAATNIHQHFFCISGVGYRWSDIDNLADVDAAKKLAEEHEIDLIDLEKANLGVIKDLLKSHKVTVGMDSNFQTRSFWGHFPRCCFGFGEGHGGS